MAIGTRGPIPEGGYDASQHEPELTPWEHITLAWAKSLQKSDPTEHLTGLTETHLDLALDALTRLRRAVREEKKRRSA